MTKNCILRPQISQNRVKRQKLATFDDLIKKYADVSGKYADSKDFDDWCFMLKVKEFTKKLNNVWKKPIKNRIKTLSKYLNMLAQFCLYWSQLTS